MKERKIVRVLKKTAREKVNCDEQKKREIIAAVAGKEVPVRRAGNLGEFLLSQLGFINKTVISWQSVWLLLFVYAMWNGELLHLSNELLYILSMAPPVLLLVTVEEISRVYNRSMLEIEYATKYSLRKVVMGRMLLLNGCNGILLVIGIVYAGRRIGLILLHALTYSLTPFMLMMLLLLIMMKKWKGRQLLYGGISIYAALAAVIFWGRTEPLNIYNPDYLKLWIAMLSGCTLGAGYQIRKLWKMLGHFELVAD